MPTFTFAPHSTAQPVSWGSPLIWSGFVVPNAPDADVLIPAITEQSVGLLSYQILIGANSAYAVNSLDMAGNSLGLQGNLSVTNGFTLDSAQLALAGGTLSVGSFQNLHSGTIQSEVVGSPIGNDIQGTGSMINAGSINGNDLILSFAGFQNLGLLDAQTRLFLDVTGPTGGFANLSNSILSGGTYQTEGSFTLNIGGSIVTDAANIELDGTDAVISTTASNGDNDRLQSTLQTIAPSGLLTLGDTTYTTVNTLAVQGTIDLASATGLATLSPAELDVAATGQIAGSGLITGPVVNDGVIVASLQPDFPPEGPGDLVFLSSITGSGSLVIAAGAAIFNGAENIQVSNTIELAGTVSENVHFIDGSGTLVLDYPESSYTGTIIPTASGDAIVLSGVSFSSITGFSYFGNSAGGVLALDQPGGSIDLNFAGNLVTSDFTVTAGPQQFSSTPPNVLIIEDPSPCFAAGSHIMTASGEMRVEDLSVGDFVLTTSGEALPITWIGRRKISCRGHPHPKTVEPVRIARGAFAPHVPNRALLLSPDHAVFTDGVLIPVKYLINDLTIVQIAMNEVTYYHVELSRHDVLLAEGLPVKSYLDTGDRRNFENTDGAIQLFPDFSLAANCASTVWDAFAYAPLAVAGTEVTAVRQQLARRARALRDQPAEQRHRRTHAS